MARDIDRKLRLTAALLGTVARKDLAAAFRRVNANTSFDIGRADKWLQGRAQPRERQVYEDWAKVLELDRSGQWIADCDIDSFLDEICVRHGRDRNVLSRDIEVFSGRVNGQNAALSLAGTFVCYSHAWSPYFQGRLIRGELTIANSSTPNRLHAFYTEVLPTGLLELKGMINIGKRATQGSVGEDSSGVPTLTFCLFPASPPASVLGGLMFGTTLIGPDAQPSVTRIAMVRLPAANARLRSTAAYLPAQASIAGDLGEFGLRVRDAAAADRLLSEFLAVGVNGFDQVSVPAYRALADLFDRIWLSDLS
ncbi:hypothetical protein [Reyranella massiliensis]|uniref:hypothetical protein n=1 Tax=Reyranella massiliensis TaxID=445220 RepID=UPI0002DB1729|nr:hypothetical protein [Reyranella massiliensis]